MAVGGPLRRGLDLDLEVTRWGTSSFDVGIVGTAAERPVLTATLVYVSTVPGPGHRPAGAR